MTELHPETPRQRLNLCCKTWERTSQGGSTVLRRLLERQTPDKVVIFVISRSGCRGVEVWRARILLISQQPEGERTEKDVEVSPFVTLNKNIALSKL